jgi:putative xylitol transport system permease protein
MVERLKPSANTAKDVAQRLLRHESAVLAIILAGLIAVMSVVTKGLSTSTTNMVNILIQNAPQGLASVGQAFVLLSGGIDVSVGGIATMSAVLGGALMTLSPERGIVSHPFSMYRGVPMMLLAGAGWGLVNGSAVSRIGMPPLIVTLAMWQITRGVAVIVGRGTMLANFPDGLLFFGVGSIAGVPVPIIMFIVVAAIGYFVLNFTGFGRSIYAIGGNPVSAWLSGINLRRARLLVYVISGFLAALAAVLSMGRVMSASTETLKGLEIDSIAAVTVGGLSITGGKGSMIGVVLGVLIIAVVNNAMSILGANPATQGIVTGAIIFAAVAIDLKRGVR